MPSKKSVRGMFDSCFEFSVFLKIDALKSDFFLVSINRIVLRNPQKGSTIFLHRGMTLGIIKLLIFDRFVNIFDFFEN